jgi:hypothetical protein
MSNFTTTKRARLGPTRAAMAEVLGNPDCANILQPLWETKGMVWPYTPDVTAGGMAAYSSYHFTHSNYPYWNFQNSMPQPIQIAGTFTAQTNEEGRYLLAVLRFLRGVTMMEFGIPAALRGVAGTPPPVLRFNYLGNHMFNNIPVVVTDFNFTLQRDVDYVEVQLPDGTGRAGLAGFINDAIFGDAVVSEGNKTYLPTRMELVTQLQIQQNTRNVRENFDLAAFKRGDLINKGFI